MAFISIKGVTSGVTPGVTPDSVFQVPCTRVEVKKFLDVTVAAEISDSESTLHSGSFTFPVHSLRNQIDLARGSLPSEHLQVKNFVLDKILDKINQETVSPFR